MHLRSPASFFLTDFGSFLGIQVLEADMLDLPFGPETFDVVIEKGTLVSYPGIGRGFKSLMSLCL